MLGMRKIVERWRLSDLTSASNYRLPPGRRIGTRRVDRPVGIEYVESSRKVKLGPGREVAKMGNFCVGNGVV
jgi:hypothetical protein